MIRILTAMLVLATGTINASAQTREEQVRGDRKKVEAQGLWIYNDLPKAFAEAKRSGKPMMVVLRCIPCHECVKLDDELVDQDPRIRPLLDKFVCVRQVSTNGLDLSLFQYDFDQSFAVVFLNANETIYGRYGTRSHRTIWANDVSIEGLSKAMKGALELHAEYPKNRGAFAAKRGKKYEFPAPEKAPSLKGKYTDKLNYGGNVVKSCIHCHQVGDAQRQYYLDKKQPLPEDVLFQYPHPKILGLILDPKERSTVKSVDEGSLAAKAGFQKDDEILSLESQPLLSIADVQWVLHHADDGDTLKATVLRDGRNQTVSLTLPKGWRRMDDISWRVTSWPFRRMTTGGMRLEALSEEDRRKAGIEQGKMALKVVGLGRYGPHATARRSGFRENDILTSLGDRDDLLRETDWLTYAVNQYRPGKKVPVGILRGRRKLSINLPMQK